METQHHSGCWCGGCNGNKDFKWISCTCGVCDPGSLSWIAYGEYIGELQLKKRERHDSLCTCDDMFDNRCKYIHFDRGLRHWNGCECPSGTNIHQCCCPVCNQSVYEKMVNNSLEDDHPWGKLVETVGKIEIRQDTNIGFTVHTLNIITSAISLDDARLATREIQTESNIDINPPKIHKSKSDLNESEDPDDLPEL
jgi:hypothetical protein